MKGTLRTHESNLESESPPQSGALSRDPATAPSSPSQGLCPGTTVSPFLLPMRGCQDPGQALGYTSSPT